MAEPAGAMLASTKASAAGATHTALEDAQAMVTGTLLASLGIAMLSAAGLTSGGLVGLAFLLHSASGVSFGPLLVAVNLPFYALALKKKGWKFVVKTFIAVLLVSLITDRLPQVLHFSHIDAIYAAIMGGLLCGIGMLVLFRHGASLGGFNILSLYLQDRFGWRVGVTQFVCSAVIMLASFAVIPSKLALISLVSTAVLNLALTMNHRPERYQG